MLIVYIYCYVLGETSVLRKLLKTQMTEIRPWSKNNRTLIKDGGTKKFWEDQDT